MNKSSAEIVKTPKQILKEKLQACEKQCNSETLRAAKSAFVAYFRVKYLKSLKDWKEKYASKNRFSSITNPEERNPEDKRLEQHFILYNNDFFARLHLSDKDTDLVLNQCFESIETLLSNEAYFKADQRYSDLKSSLKYREALLGHSFTDLEAQIQSCGAKVQEAQNPAQGQLLEKEKLKSALEELMRVTDAAYEMGIKAGKLPKRTNDAEKNKEERSKYRNSKIAPFIRKDLISAEMLAQYSEYVKKTKARFVDFQAEYVARALLKRTGDVVPEEANFPTACDLELDFPKGNLLDLLNAKCLKETLYAVEIEELPDIKIVYQAVKDLEAQCASLYEGLGQELKTLKAPSYPEFYFKFKAIKKCIDELCQRVGSDPSGILKHCMPAKFNEAVSLASKNTIEKILGELNKRWSAILAKAQCWELREGKIVASVEECKRVQGEFSLLFASAMLEEEVICKAYETFQKNCKAQIEEVAEERRKGLSALYQKLEKAINWETLVSVAGFSLIEDEIVARQTDYKTVGKNESLSEEGFKEKLQELALILRVDLSVEYRSEFDALKKKFEQVKAQRTLILEKKREVNKFITEVATCKDEEIAQKCLDCFNWVAQWSPQTITQMFEKKFADLFWVHVYLNIGFGEFTKAVATRIVGPLNKIEDKLKELCVQNRQVGGMSVVKAPPLLTNDALEKTIALAKEQMEELKKMAIGDVYDKFLQAKKWLPSEEVKAVLKQITGKAPDEEVQAKLNRFEEIIAERRKAIGGRIIELIEVRLGSLKSLQDRLDLQLQYTIHYTLDRLKREIKDSEQDTLNEVELHKKIQELIETVGSHDLEALSAKLAQYNTAVEHYQSTRDVPRKVEEMNQRLKGIDTELKSCKLDNFGTLSARVAAERAIVDKDKTIPLRWVTLEASEKALQAKKKKFEEELMSQISEYTKSIFNELNLEIEKGTGDFGKIQNWLTAIEGVVATATDQGLILNEGEMAAYLEHRQETIIKILKAHNTKTLEVVDVDAGSLSPDAYKKNRAYFDNEFSFAEKMKIVCQKSELTKAYTQYQSNLDRAILAFNDQEQECLFFEKMKALDTFRNFTLDTMDSNTLSLYGQTFRDLSVIMDARLENQAKSVNPRNLNDCFRAFDNAIPNPPESETADEQLKNIPVQLEQWLEQRRKNQMENFKTKINAAIQAKDFALAEKLVGRLNPSGIEMAECWGYYVFSIFKLLSNDRTLTPEAFQTQNMHCLRDTLIKMGSCTAEQRVDFCNFILTPLLQLPLTRYTVDLEALILLLRISEDSRYRKGWFFWPDGIGEIADYLPDPLGIMHVMKQFSEGQMVDGEDSPDKWCRAKLLYVNSIVKPQLEKGTEKRSEKSVKFLTETGDAYDNYCRRDQAAPAREKTSVLAKGGLLAKRKALVGATAPQAQPAVVVETTSGIQDRNVGLAGFVLGVRPKPPAGQETVFGEDESPRGQEQSASSAIVGFFNTRYASSDKPRAVEEVAQSLDVVLESGRNLFNQLYGIESRGASTNRSVAAQPASTTEGTFIANLYGQNGSRAVQPKNQYQQDVGFGEVEHREENGFGFGGFGSTNGSNTFK